MMMTKTLAALSVAVLIPFGAGASTLNPSNTIVDGGSYDMLGSHFFAEAFKKSDGAGTREFTFTNTNTVSQNMLLTSATVNALSTMFKDGVTFTWLGSGLTMFVDQSLRNFSDSLDNMIAAGASDTLQIAFGDPKRRQNGSDNGTAHISVEFEAMPAAVPLPAGGLMLISAIGGIAALRRRRKAAKAF